MGAPKRSRVVPAKTKKGGVRQNQHVFQGFHERAARLTINPVQSARQQDERSTESYLKARLEFWKDTNLSKNFVDFTREFEPLCDSLAQILHNEERIFALLAEYIQGNDENSVEPLLDLLSQFAHDVGARFEKFFASALQMVVTLVSSHQQIEVIEWSFNTLAWLFQYLSKLLVPDLRPTYDALAPLLGKRVRKEHVARFAAEAMSFLVRKAASKYHRDAKPLNAIVEHMLEDWSKSDGKDSNEDIYGYGLMTLFADAIKDVKASHSFRINGLPVYQALVKHCLSSGNATIATGVTTNLIHHAQANTFTGILASALEAMKGLDSEASTSTILAAHELLFTLAAVRKGDRVSDWQAVFQTWEHLHGLLQARASAVFSHRPTLLAATIIQTASFDSLISRLNKMVNIVSEQEAIYSFPQFCAYAWQINPDRFHELLKPFMFRYLARHWDEGNVRMLFTAQRIFNSDSKVARNLTQSSKNDISHWSRQLVPALQKWTQPGSQLESDETDLPMADAVLDLAALSNAESGETLNSIAEYLQILISDSANRTLSGSSTKLRFAFGGAFAYYLKNMPKERSSDSSMWTDITAVQSALGSMALYLDNLDTFLSVTASNQLPAEDLVQTLIRNLSSGWGPLRLVSLKLLNRFYCMDAGSESSALLTAISIEDTTPDHQSLRVLAMHVARLPKEYEAGQIHPWLGKAITQYLFGALTIGLAPLWAEVTNALKQIYDQGNGDGVQLVEDMAFQWLHPRSQVSMASHNDDQASPPEGPINGFECTNARKWLYIFDRWSSDLSHSDERIRDTFDQKHEQAPNVPENSIQQALRVLAAIPALAERRSRRLVPLFLNWASTDDDADATLLEEASSDSSDGTQPTTFTKRDQKAMLDIFGMFQNPGVLHQHEQVYNALLRLLGNGDVVIQKAALKALSTWKKSSVKRYQEELNNLLDNARFREELVVFLPSQFRNEDDAKQQSDMSTPQRKELMPVLLRLLYGRIIARGAAAAGRTSQQARRKAVFESLANFPDDDLTSFVEIALGPLYNLALKDGQVVCEEPSAAAAFPARKQLGLVRLISDLIDCLGDKVDHLADRLLNATLYCLDSVKAVEQDTNEHGDEEEVFASTPALHKAVRQGALQSLIRIFQKLDTVDVERYSQTVVSVAVGARLGPSFVGENSQSVSSTLQLLAAWASKSRSKVLLLVDERLLPRLLGCLDTKSQTSGTKSEVKVFILERILTPLVTGADDDLERRLSHVQLYEPILVSAAQILEQGGTKDLLAAAVAIALQIARPDMGTDQQRAGTSWSASVSTQLTKVFCTLLDLPQHVVSAATKTSTLVVLTEVIPTLQSESCTDLLSQLYNTLSKLFTSARDAAMRVELSKAFQVTANMIGPQSQAIANLCVKLNSFSMGRLEEPDFDEREKSIEQIAIVDNLGENEWTPLVYNALFFIRDQEELVIRKGATRILRRFVEKNSSMESAGDIMFPVSKLMRGVLLPALRRGASERAEVVRVEYLGIMAHLIRICPHWTEIQDLSILATAADDSESFFDGVLHIQQDWRKRSLIKLARVARQGHLTSNSIAHYLLPLVQQFVFDRADDDDAHSLSAQAVTTIGALASGLDWTQARKTLRHYSGIIKDKPELEKAVIRLIGVTTEAIYSAAKTNSETTLKITMPGSTQLDVDISGTLLPPLVNFLHHKDENVVSLRVPIAVSAARLVCLLPEATLEYKLAPVLTDVCHILRSKAQESRDLSRKTLSEIAALIGPQKFAFILKELRIALSRGYQLHVLSYTVHSLLVEADFQPGQLDYCLPQIMRIILDDTFGATGQEKDADGYTNKDKEIKSSKSMDTAERMARITTIEHLKEFVLPIQRLLVERLDSKGTAKADELLRRVRNGLEHNGSIGSMSALIFCFEVLQQANTTATGAKSTTKYLSRKEQQQRDTFEIKTKGARKAPVLPRISSQQYKLARFALDLLREILRRHEGLRTPNNLKGFLKPVGDVLYESQEEVQISALRFLASILRVPMKEWETDALVYADAAYKALRNQPDTNTELSQAAIKLLTSIIHDRPEVSLKDSQVSWLIKAVIPDLKQPSAQGVTFNFLKAIIQRRIVINETYEAMDALAELFITYSDTNTRNQARSIWLQFVTTYEQSEKRFNQQLNFLSKNLEYRHSDGRQSVMEAIHFLLSKLDHEHLQKAVLFLFVPIMSKFIGDEVASCRDMAGLLLQTTIAKANDDSLQTVRKALQNYLATSSKKSVQAAALRVYTCFVEVDHERAIKDLPSLQQNLQTLLNETIEQDTADWELPYYALKLMEALAQAFRPELSSPKLQPLWSAVYRFSAYPHAWVKYAAARLMRMLFADLDNASSTGSRVLTTRSGLTINQLQLCDLIRSYFRTMLRTDVQDWLVKEITQSLETLEQTAGGLVMISDGPIDQVEADASGEDDDGAEERPDAQTLREYSVRRIAAIVRRDSPIAAKQAALQLLASIIKRVSADDLGPLLSDILQPLNHLTDFNITRAVQPDESSREKQAQLVEDSQEIMRVLQRKLPDGAYVSQMHKVQQEMKARREERRGKRRIEAVADPEAYAKFKAKKRARGQDRRKERNMNERSKRRGY